MPENKKINSNNDSLDEKLAKKKIKRKWRQDSAGKLFTYSASKKIPCVYRFWAVLKDLVDVSLLQKALENIMPRFPYYHVKLSRGFAWFKWKKVDEMPQVEKELDYPCKFIPVRNTRTFPFRIIANFNQIIIEFFHGLTDGTGALIFLRSLVSEYLVLNGYSVDDWSDIFRPGQDIDPAETEYSYRKNFKLGIPKIPKVYRAYHLPFKRVEKGITYVTNAKLDVNEVLKIARDLKISITEFLAAIYADVIQEIMFELKEKGIRKRIRPVRIMVPINARNIIPSKTMRNFTTFMAPGIDPRLGKHSFEEIVENIHYQKNLNLTEKAVIQQLSYYVAIETNPFVVAVPFFLKVLFVKPIYRKMGEELFSGFLTNLGRTKMPVELSEVVKDIQIIPMNHPYFKTGCGFLTYFDELNLNFVRNIKEEIVEEKFFNKLRNFGLELKITRLF
ncbi:MAG: hypothetical protein FK730_06035 [Asgard group archaeon]|nr:hypothetical protein [Asgard group archaeon]